MYAITHPSELTVPLERAIATMSLVLDALENELIATGRAKSELGVYAALCDNVVDRAKSVYWPTLDGVYASLQEMREACEASEKSA